MPRRPVDLFFHAPAAEKRNRISLLPRNGLCRDRSAVCGAIHMHVLVLGGYGLIGLPAVRRLVEAGHRVTGLGRSVRAARISHHDVAWIEQDIARLTDPADWLPILPGIDAVVNCSGALQDSGRDNLQALQSNAMRAIFEACRMIPVPRVVQVSAAGVSLEAATPFFRTKAEADAALMRSDLAWIILRPGLVIAPAAYGGTALIRGLASFPFMLPVVGGTQLMQTVGVDDVADAILAAVEGRVASGAIYDLVEDRPHTLQEVILAFRSWLEHPAAPVLRTPDWIGRVLFKAGDALSRLGWRPPLRTTALLQLEAGVTGDPSAWLRERGRVPSSLQEALRRTPSTVQERWFGRLWLMKPIVIAALCLFWLASGLIGLVEWEAASAILTRRGIGEGIATLAVMGGSLLDIALGVMLLVRPTHRAAALGMIATTLAYLAAGTALAPELWLDPLGAFVKTLPGLVLALVALAIADER
jgi:uncharacterized protein YbjT (DUF2867 family)